MKFLNAAPSVPSLTILLIDHNRQGLMARKSILEEQGYSVTTASAGEDGLQQFSAGNFDLVVTEYKMPRINGADVIAPSKRSASRNRRNRREARDQAAGHSHRSVRN